MINDEYENYKLRITNDGISTRSVVIFCRAKKEAISAATYVQSGTDDQYCSRGFQSTGRLIVNDECENYELRELRITENAGRRGAQRGTQGKLITSYKLRITGLFHALLLCFAEQKKMQ